MTLESRLKKVEDLVDVKNKRFSMCPILITIYEDDNEEEIFKHLEAKYGPDFYIRKPIIVKAPKKREEVAKGSKIEDL